MHVVPKGKKLFLMDEMMNDMKSVKKERSTTANKSKVKQELPSVVPKTELKPKIERNPAKKSKASTKVKCTPTDSVQPSIKLTIRRKPSKIDSSAEYEIVRR